MSKVILDEEFEEEIDEDDFEYDDGVGDYDDEYDDFW